MSTAGRTLTAALAAAGLGAVLLIGLPRPTPAPAPAERDAALQRILAERFGPAEEGDAATVSALAALGAPAIPELVRLWLGDGNATCERALDRDDLWIGAGKRLSEVAARALARLPVDDVLQHLSARAETASAQQERIALLRLCGRLDSAAALPLLFRLADRLGPLAQRSRSVSSALAGSLARILEADPAAPAVLEGLVEESGGRLIPPVIAAVEEASTPRGMGLLVAILEDERAPEARVIRAIGTLGSRYAWCFDGFPLFHVRPRLGSVDVDVRRAATVALGELREAEAAADLLALLDDDDPLVRRAAATGLGRLSALTGTRAPADWKAWLEGEESWFEERFELECADLESDEPTRIARALRELAGHPLHRHDAARAIVAALPMLESELLGEACRTLVGLDSRHAVPGLFAVLETEIEDPARHVLTTLVALTGHRPGEDADAWRGLIEG